MSPARRLRFAAVVAAALALPAIVAVAQEDSSPTLPDQAAETAVDAVQAAQDGPSQSDAPSEPDTSSENGEAADPEQADPFEADDVEEADEDGAHGAAVSAAAECLPSGSDLHGTGLTKGVLMRAVAHGEPVDVDGLQFTVTDGESAAALCEAVTVLSESAEAPDTARGRPDHAGGPGEGGPPDHAGRPDHAGPPSDQG